MKTSSVFLTLVLTLTLSACSKVALSPTLEQQLTNPLFAEQYWEDLVDRMATISINKEYEKDTAKQSLVDAVRADALSQAQAATKKRSAGMAGSFVSAKEQVQGQALFLDKMLFMGPGFITYPGPSLHLYLSDALDPRTGPFPDKTAIDLGLLQTPYGAQSYALPADKSADTLRTAVLYDDKLGRLYGFAQMGK